MKCFKIFLLSLLVLSNGILAQQPPFLCGFGNAEYQVSGSVHCPHNQWAYWEKQSKKYPQAGIACDFWNNWQQDILLAQSQGANAFRFSIEWSNCEPQEGTWDEAAFAHYDAMIDFMLEHHITPVITLHHFTDPLWFFQKQGFEKEENSQYFVRFAQEAFKRFGHKVHIWCTINEPTIYAYMGYVLGMFPGRTELFPLSTVLIGKSHVAEVLKNLLITHVQTYQALKSMPHGDEAQIGIVHQFLKFLPYHSWNIADKALCSLQTHITHDVAFEFLRTGIFHCKLPHNKPVHYEDSSAPRSYDFIGINYYSRVLVNFCMPTHAPGEKMTDYPYAIYPQGLYETIAEASALKVPIYITENGICDAKDDRREEYIRGYTDALKRALRDGYNVRGYFYWTLMDNYEWHEGYKKKFGLYAVDFATQKRTLREGGKCLKDIFQEIKQELQVISV